MFLNAYNYNPLEELRWVSDIGDYRGDMAEKATDS